MSLLTPAILVREALMILRWKYPEVAGGGDAYERVLFVDGPFDAQIEEMTIEKASTAIIQPAVKALGDVVPRGAVISAAGPQVPDGAIGVVERYNGIAMCLLIDHVARKFQLALGISA